MSSYTFETSYGICVSSVLLTQYPRVGTITFTHVGVIYELRVVNPQPLSAVTESIDECYQFRIVDLDKQLNFGRYKIEIWDEDNDYAEFIADSFEQVAIAVDPNA